MARFGIIDKEGNVVNVIIWDGAEWLPPKNHYVVQLDNIDVNDFYDLKTGILTKRYDQYLQGE